MISVAVIGRNEAGTLGATLESVLPYASEIVFVDTGSTDATPMIAAAYGARVSNFNWTDDFSAARNAALKQCTGRWVLTIDCDEVLIAGDAIKNFFESLEYDSSAIAFMVPIHNVLQNNRRDMHFDIRFFRKESGIYFCNPIHESVTPSIHRLYPNAEFVTAAFSIDHYGYSSSEKNEKKLDRPQNILLQWTESEPDNPYAWYKLGLTLRSRAARYASACLFKSFELLVAREDRNSFAFRFDLVRTLLDSLKGSDKALERLIKSEAARAFPSAGSVR